MYNVNQLTLQPPGLCTILETGSPIGNSSHISDFGCLRHHLVAQMYTLHHVANSLGYKCC